MCCEVGLVFVRESNGVYYKCLIQNRFLADSQNMEVLSASAVVTYVAEIQIETVLGYFFHIPTAYFVDAKGFRNRSIDGVNPVKAVVIVVIESPVAIIPKEQRGGAVQ